MIFLRIEIYCFGNGEKKDFYFIYLDFVRL